MRLQHIIHVLLVCVINEVYLFYCLVVCLISLFSKYYPQYLTIVITSLELLMGSKYVKDGF